VSKAGEISDQVARESGYRERLGVPSFGGGVLYLLGGIIVSQTLSGAPTVGLLQGLTPAFRGEANPAVSPRTAEVKFISHHGFALVAGSTLTAVAVVILMLVLLLLLYATRFRRPETWAPARPLVLVGGIGLPLLNLLHSVILAIGAHNFAGGHDFSNHAVDRALLTAGSLGLTLGFAGLLAALALAVGMAAVMLGAMRVGLLPRWMSILGIFAGLFFLPFFSSATLELITAFWMVAMGILLMGRWPNGEPPAWAAGEARPWPSQAERRAEAAGEPAGKRAENGSPELAQTASSVETDGDRSPVNGKPSKPGKRRRKRKARR
jgi:hypothetical protein